MAMYRIGRREAQKAVGRVPVRDVLLGLKAGGLIRGFRVTDLWVSVEADRALEILVEGIDDAGVDPVE